MNILDIYNSINTVKPGLYESELCEILDYTNFLPDPGEIPSYTLKVWVVRKSELYECFRLALAIRITQIWLYTGRLSQDVPLY